MHTHTLFRAALRDAIKHRADQMNRADAVADLAHTPEALKAKLRRESANCLKMIGRYQTALKNS